MARLGAFCFPGTGHINPMTALARRLELRGHKVVIFGIADTESRVKSAGIEFHLIGEQDYPPGTLQKLDEHLAKLKGLETFRFTVERVKNTARMVLRDGPDAVRNANVDALLVDEADMGGNVAEHLGLPFVSIAFFPPLLADDRIPPFCFGWNGKQDWLSRLRNRLGMRLLSRVAAPIYKVVNAQRKVWGLKPLKRAPMHSRLWLKSRSYLRRWSLRWTGGPQIFITPAPSWMRFSVLRLSFPGSGWMGAH